MAELGVLGLMVGLWIALAQPVTSSGGHRVPYPNRLGWLLAGLSMVLILATMLGSPGSFPSRGCVTSCSPGHGHTAAT